MRIAGWESRLNTYLASQEPFIWGQRDCALWSAFWVKDCTGEDHTHDWFGKYKTEGGAAKRMKRLGFESVADIASSHLREIPVPFAQRGDLVLNAQGCLGIGNGPYTHFLTLTGQTLEPTLNGVRAWRVG